MPRKRGTTSCSNTSVKGVECGEDGKEGEERRGREGGEEEGGEEEGGEEEGGEEKGGEEEGGEEEGEERIEKGKRGKHPRSIFIAQHINVHDVTK